jgi:hypothetical protein
MPVIEFREDFATRQVVVSVDNTERFRHKEYMSAAIWARDNLSLSDPELMDIYRDYKEDYDSQKM